VFEEPSGRIPQAWTFCDLLIPGLFRDEGSIPFTRSSFFNVLIPKEFMTGKKISGTPVGSFLGSDKSLKRQ